MIKNENDLTREKKTHKNIIHSAERVEQREIKKIKDKRMIKEERNRKERRGMGKKEEGRERKKEGKKGERKNKETRK